MDIFVYKDSHLVHTITLSFTWSKSANNCQDKTITCLDKCRYIVCYSKLTIVRHFFFNWLHYSGLCEIYNHRITFLHILSCVMLIFLNYFLFLNFKIKTNKLNVCKQEVVKRAALLSFTTKDSTKIIMLKFDFKVFAYVIFNLVIILCKIFKILWP